MKVSIVIVTFNNGSTIKKCLDSVLDSTLEKEVIVVDNASEDGTAEIVKGFSGVKLIQNKINLGFGKANNLGVKQASGKNLFFLNPDCKVQGSAVRDLTNYLEENTEVSVVGPKLLNVDGSIQRELVPFPTLLNQILILLKLHRTSLFERFVYPDYNYEKLQEVEHLMGAALLLRKETFEETKGFDERFFLWFEETDLLKRIKDNKGQIIYFATAIVTHIGSASIKKINPLKRQLIWNKSLLYYFKKHKGWFKLSLLLPFVVLSFFPAAALSLKNLLTK